jgi:cell division septum initiation protein DivIVA
MREPTNDAGLRRRIAELEAELQRYREQEQLVAKTLVSATAQATTIREGARREAQLTLRKARAEAGRRKAAAERERDDAIRELLRLRRITEQMRKGLSAFLTKAVEELQLEETDRAQASAEKPELEPTLANTVQQHSTGATSWPEDASGLRAEIPRPGEDRSIGGSPNDLP